ncbi:MAG: hypothetical protein MUF81_18620, partial [Verrucomicrobia bacterium]|nr:hypothetical protein [Verrucomicrobiota bacterium]
MLQKKDASKKDRVLDGTDLIVPTNRFGNNAESFPHLNHAETNRGYHEINKASRPPLRIPARYDLCFTSLLTQSAQQPGQQFGVADVLHFRKTGQLDGLAADFLLDTLETAGDTEAASAFERGIEQGKELKRK